MWVVALSQPNGERKALLNLKRQGYVTFAPRFRKTVVVGGKKVVREVLLFNRYIFVWIVDQWHSIRGTYGVASLMMVGDAPARVPDKEIESLMRREREDGFVAPRFVAGQKLRIHGGQFTGFDAIYEGMSAFDREVVLLNILGRQSRVELPSGNLSA